MIMLEILIGKKGTGKTKALIEKVNAASTVADGNIVFICHDMSDTYNVKSQVRMCTTKGLGMKSFDDLLFYINGLLAGNYDITNIFIDGVFKIVGSDSLDGAEHFINSIKKLSDVSFVISMSMDAEEAPAYIKELL